MPEVICTQNDERPIPCRPNRILDQPNTPTILLLGRTFYIVVLVCVFVVQRDKQCALGGNGSRIGNRTTTRGPTHSLRIRSSLVVVLFLGVVVVVSILRLVGGILPNVASTATLTCLGCCGRCCCVV